LAATEVFQDNFLNGMTITITAGTGANQTRTILDYDMATNAATVSPAWTTAPVSGSKYEVKANGIGTGNYIQLTTAGTVAKAVNLPPTWDESNLITIDGLKLRGSITGVSAAAQAVITSPGHGLADGDEIAIAGVRGQITVNSGAGQVHTVDKLTDDTFSIPVDTSMGSAYESGTGWWGNWEAK
jgi:hypothetical protein